MEDFVVVLWTSTVVFFIVIGFSYGTGSFLLHSILKASSA